MDWGGRLTPAMRALAVNVLSLWIPEHDFVVGFGSTSRRAVAGAAQFAEVFLLGMPVSGGCVPGDVVREWIREEL